MASERSEQEEIRHHPKAEPPPTAESIFLLYADVLHRTAESVSEAIKLAIANPTKEAIDKLASLRLKELPWSPSDPVLVSKWFERHFPANEIHAVTRRAEEVLGTREKATLWLSTPNLATDNKAPIDLIGDEGGSLRVLQLLGRIEAGTLA